MQPQVRQTEGRRSAAEWTLDGEPAAAGLGPVAADTFKTKPTGLRPAPAADDRANVPGRSASRSGRYAALDHTADGRVDKENTTAARRQSVDSKPQSTSKPASEDREKTDKPRTFTVLVTQTSKEVPNAAELIKQLGGIYVPDCKGATVTHCVVGDWATTEKVSTRLCSVPSCRCQLPIPLRTDAASVAYCLQLSVCSAQSLSASLVGAWMMPPEWLLASAAAGKWLDEAQHTGWRSTVSPFESKRIAFDASFVVQEKGVQARLLEALIQAGKGKLVMADLAHPHSFDAVVMGQDATAADKSKWPSDKQTGYHSLMVAAHSHNRLLKWSLAQTIHVLDADSLLLSSNCACCADRPRFHFTCSDPSPRERLTARLQLRVRRVRTTVCHLFPPHTRPQPPQQQRKHEWSCCQATTVC